MIIKNYCLGNDKSLSYNKNQTKGDKHYEKEST